MDTQSEENYIHLSYKFRLYPSSEQIKILKSWQEICLDIHRWAILDRRWAQRQYKQYMYWREVQMLNPDIGVPEITLPERRTWVSQSKQFTLLKKSRPQWNIPPDDVTRAVVVTRVEQAWEKQTENRKAGIPSEAGWPRKAADVGLQFRGQADRGTILVRQDRKYGYWKLAGGKALGELKVRMHRAFPEGVHTRQVHITHAADGWYISFSCNIPQPVFPKPSDRAFHGVDIGCVHDGNVQRVAVVGDGRIYTSNDELKRLSRRLATLQKLVSHKRRTRKPAKSADPASNRTRKRRARIARLHQDITRQREHRQHFIARRIVDTANTIGFEDLNHQGMRAKGKGSKKRGLNRSLSTSSPGRLIQFAKEKASLLGRQVVLVDARNTSQMCSVCEKIGRKKDLSVRVWTCEFCGTTHDRDVNAARNIQRRAEEL